MYAAFFLTHSLSLFFTVSQFDSELERDCCLDGMKEVPLSYTCEERKAYIVDGQACADAFLQCCTTMNTQLSEKREENFILARSKKWEPIGGEQYSFFPKRNINVQQHFRWVRWQLLGQQWNCFSNQVPRKLAVDRHPASSLPCQCPKLVSHLKLVQI